MQGIYIKDDDIDKIVNMLYANNQNYGFGMQNQFGHQTFPGGMGTHAGMQNFPYQGNYGTMPTPAPFGMQNNYGNINIADIIRMAYATDSKLIQKKELGGEDKGTYIMIPFQEYKGTAIGGKNGKKSDSSNSKESETAKAA